MHKKLIDLCNLRTQALADAETALNANQNDAYNAAMERVANLNTEIERVQNLIAEQERQIDQRQPTQAEARDMAEDRGAKLMRGEAVTFSSDELRLGIRNSTNGILYSGALVQPSAAGSEIHDLLGNGASSIVDQVRVMDMTGMSGYSEPYVISEIDVDAGAPSTTTGTTRATSDDPVFGVAEFHPYELTTTSFVDRNIALLSPANYYAKVREMAMRAMRRKLADLIVNGDGGNTPSFFGMKNATNKAGASIFAAQNVSAVDVNLLDTLYFAYGSSEEIGGNARLLLTKADLKAIGQIRGANEKRRLFTITPDAGNANCGVISDGGVIIPYTICPDLTSLSASTAGAAAIQTMIYGDPFNFTVGLFGDFTVRVDESVKAVERMHAILGDAMVGGNLTVHHGSVVATVPAVS